MPGFGLKLENHRIFKLVQAPFKEHDGDEAFAAQPPPEMCHLEVSCSS